MIKEKININFTEELKLEMRVYALLLIDIILLCYCFFYIKDSENNVKIYEESALMFYFFIIRSFWVYIGGVTKNNLDEYFFLRLVLFICFNEAFSYKIPFINQYLYICMILISTVIVFLFVCEKNSKENLFIFNNLINFVFIICFLSLILSNDFFNIKNFLFGISSYKNFENNLNYIKTGVFIFTLLLVSYPINAKLEYYAEKLNILITIFFIGIAANYIIKTPANIIDYDFFTYILATMILMLTVVSLVTQKALNVKDLSIIILFKILIIFYVIFSKDSTFLSNICSIIILFFMNLFILKKELINKWLMKITIFLILFSILCSEFIFFKKDLPSTNNYSGIMLILFYLMGMVILNKKNKKTKKEISNLIDILMLKKINPTSKIDGERIYRRKFPVDIKKISWFILYVMILITIVYVGKNNFVLSWIEGTEAYRMLYNDSDFITFYSKSSENILKNFYIIVIFITLSAVLSFLFMNRIIFTNKRVIRLDLTKFSYEFLDYDELRLEHKNKNTYIYYENEEIFKLRKNDIFFKNFLKKKVSSII